MPKITANMQKIALNNIKDKATTNDSLMKFQTFWTIRPEIWLKHGEEMKKKEDSEAVMTNLHVIKDKHSISNVDLDGQNFQKHRAVMKAKTNIVLFVN